MTAGKACSESMTTIRRVVEPAAEVAGEDAEHEPGDERAEDGGNGDAELDAGAEDEPREQVAAELVRAEEVVERGALEARGDVLRVGVVRRDKRRDERATRRIATTTSPNSAGRPAHRPLAATERRAPSPPSSTRAVRSLDGDGHQRPCSARMRGSRKPVGEVGEQVGEHEQDRDDEHAAAHDRVVARLDRVVDQRAEARGGRRSPRRRSRRP